MHHDRDTLQKMHDDRYARTICIFWREPFSLFVIKRGSFLNPDPTANQIPPAISKTRSNSARIWPIAETGA